MGSKSSRNSSIELLRIASMLLIVTGHLVTQNQFFENLDGIQLFISFFAGSAARISVNIFLLIGVWFMVDSDFSSRRIIDIYVETWLYSAILAVTMLILGVEASKLAIAKSFFPFILRGVWFVSSYLALLVLHPFYKIIIKRFTKKELTRLIVVLVLFIWIISLFNKPQDHWMDNLAWFSFVYFLIAWYKKYYQGVFKLNKYISLVTGLSIYTLLVFIAYASYNNAEKSLFYRIHTYVYGNVLMDIKSVPCFLCALFVFYYFINTSFTCKFINTLARHTLSVYIIHQSPTFIRFLWDKIFECYKWVGTEWTILGLVFTPIIIFFVCMPIDYLRRKFIMPLIMKTKLYHRIEMQFDDYYSVIS